MKSVLVAYGTTEGQARKVAEFIADALKAHGVEVELVDSAVKGAMLLQPVYAAVIVCGSLHQRSYQASLVRFVKDNKDWLVGIPTAFIAVSLTAVLKDDESREAKNCGNSRRRSIGQPAGRRPSRGTWLVRCGTRSTVA